MRILSSPQFSARILSRPCKRLQRAGYRAWVASGLRAWSNRVQGRVLGNHLERKLGFAAAPPGLDGWILRIDARPQPKGAWMVPEVQFGMLSAHQTRAPIARWVYRYLLARSHFGVGHVELAFFCSKQTVHLYALRNMAQGTARRWRLTQHAAALGPSEGRALWSFVEILAQEWRARGLQIRLCHPEDCLNLAIDSRWIPPAKRAEVRARLLSRYQHYARCAAQKGSNVHPCVHLEAQNGKLEQLCAVLGHS